MDCDTMDGMGCDGMGWDGKNGYILYLYQTLDVSQMAHLETVQPE